MTTYTASQNGPFYYGHDYSTEEITEMAKTLQSMYDQNADRYLSKEEPVLLDMIAENGGPKTPEEQDLVRAIKKDLKWFKQWG